MEPSKKEVDDFGEILSRKYKRFDLLLQCSHMKIWLDQTLEMHIHNLTYQTLKRCLFTTDGLLVGLLDVFEVFDSHFHREETRLPMQWAIFKFLLCNFRNLK